MSELCFRLCLHLIFILLITNQFNTRYRVLGVKTVCQRDLYPLFQKPYIQVKKILSPKMSPSREAKFRGTTVSHNFAHPLELSASCFQCLHLNTKCSHHFPSAKTITDHIVTQYAHFFLFETAISKNQIKVAITIWRVTIITNEVAKSMRFETYTQWPLYHLYSLIYCNPVQLFCSQFYFYDTYNVLFFTLS